MVYFDIEEISKNTPNIKLILSMANSLKTAVVITDARLERPGPTILFVNEAFSTMTGFRPAEIVGHSPRLLQKRVRQSPSLRELGKSLRTTGGFHGVIENRRQNGEVYYCEIDINPLRAHDNSISGYIAFEREALRRKGRPSANNTTRFTPLLDETIGELSGAFMKANQE